MTYSHHRQTAPGIKPICKPRSAFPQQVLSGRRGPCHWTPGVCRSLRPVMCHGRAHGPLSSAPSLTTVSWSYFGSRVVGYCRHPQMNPAKVKGPLQCWWRGSQWASVSLFLIHKVCHLAWAGFRLPHSVPFAPHVVVGAQSAFELRWLLGYSISHRAQVW